mgnify:CR=1 FL=1
MLYCESIRLFVHLLEAMGDERLTQLEFDKNKCFKNEWWFTAGWCIAFDS